MPISAEDRARLIKLARSALEAEVTGLPKPPINSTGGIMAEHRGCFVTLTNSGRLRGCIGTFQPHGPLAEMIVEMAGAGARDPRFVMNPITPNELDELTVEVSILSPLQETSEPAELEVGEHGIYVVRGPYSGCFLPEVATDQGWDAEQFLTQSCTGKAGLPPDAWRDKDTKVYLFTSEKFDH